MKYCINCMAKIRDTKEICPFCGQQQGEGLKNACHLSPGYTLNGGRYLLGKAVVWDSFSVTYTGRDLVGGTVITIREYVPEQLVSRRAGTGELDCVVPEELENYRGGLASFVETGKLLADSRERLVNVTEVYDSFYENGTGYIIEEHLNGQSVKELLENGHVFAWDSAKQVMDAVLEGAASMHGAGVWHQDIHPGCIIITADGQIKLTAPGGYRYQLIGDKIQRFSVVRDGYSAEEQYRKKGKTGAFTDVYALGAVMYHMITGKKPVSAAERIHEDTLEIPREIQEVVPQNIQNALMNSLLLLPGERTQTPQEFQKELSEKKVARIAGTQRTEKKGSKKKAALITAAAVIGVCVLGAVAGGVLLSGRSTEQAASGEQASIVPNLVTLSLEDAEKAAKKRGMEIEVIDVLPSDITEGSVTEQIPGNNEPAGEDGMIQVKLSGGDKSTWLFNLRGETREDAVRELKKRNLNYKEENFTRWYTTDEEGQVEEGCVIDVLIGSEEEKMSEDYRELTQGEEVNLKLSLGDYSRIPELKVPDLTGQLFEGEADATLKSLDGVGEDGITFGLEKTEEQYSVEYARGQIMGQQMPNGENAGDLVKPRLQDDTVVNIGVTVSLGPEYVKVPDVSGMTRSEAEAVLEAEGYWFDVAVVSEYSSTASAGTVLGTRESEAYQKDTVHLRVSLGLKPQPATGGGTGGTTGGSTGGSTGGNTGGPTGGSTGGTTGGAVSEGFGGD